MPLIEKFLLALLAVTVTLTVSGDAIPLRGMAWQWCYETPDQKFCLAAVDAMAAAGFNVLVPEFGPRLQSERFPAGSRRGLSRKEFRQFLVRAKERGLRVIPLLNSLDHGDRSIPWPTRLAGGFDLGTEENYTFLFDTIDEYREDFATAGLPMEYIHLGMDESSAVLLANAEKYGKSTAELLKAHILRVVEFCRSRDLRPIIWHDSLMSSNDPLYDGDMQYPHSDKAGAWTIRRELPRDLILMYWNYEPRKQYRVVDGLREEGFEVWLMPWGRASVRSMAEYAAETGIPAVIGSTWMESGYARNTPPGTNHMIRNPWLMEAIAEAAECTVDPARCAIVPTDDPVLRFINCFFPAPAEEPDFQPAATVPDEWPGRENLSVFGKAAESAVLLGEWPSGKDNLKELQLPLSLRGTDGKSVQIDAINIQRGTNQLILYTPEKGASTGCNGFGQEAVISANGVVTGRTTWGVGDSPIPSGGYVLSAHGTAMAKLNALPVGGKASVQDANGTVYQTLPGVKNDGIWRKSAGKRFQTLSFLWCTARGGTLDGAELGHVRLRYADGSETVCPLVYGRDFYSWNAPGFFWGGRDGIRVWNAMSHSTGRGSGKALIGWSWDNPRPESEVETIEAALNDAGKQYGLVIVGWEAK